MRWSIAGFAGLSLIGPIILQDGRAEEIHLEAVASPIIFRGDAVTAYRDPAAMHQEGA